MDPDQTARMRRLIWIHAGRNNVGFVVTRLIYYLSIFTDLKSAVYLIVIYLQLTEYSI
jgi:hypothetical protein